MQRCKSAYGLCKGGKVNTEKDYRVRSTDYGWKVGAWLRRALLWIGGQGEALPLPASGARERHARLARSANPTKGNYDSTWCCPYPMQLKGGTGEREIGDVAFSVIRNLNSVIFFSTTQHPRDQPRIQTASWAKALARWLSLSLVCGWSSPKVLSKPLGTKSES